MEKSDKPDDVSAPRKTLKLKSPAARPAAAKGRVGGAAATADGATPGVSSAGVPATGSASSVAASGPPPRSSRGSPRSQEAASWADEHKRRMQADMDALGGGDAGRPSAPPSRPRR